MNRFYFDHNATTPIASEVLEAYVEALGKVFGNASSIHHYGQVAKERLEAARKQVAALLGCDASELVLTGGGTEASNAAIFGAVSERQQAHVVATAIEHPAVLQPCRELERRGVEVSYVPVNSGGLVDAGEVRRAIRADTALISVMHVNNETGTIQPIAEIARVAREAGVLLHSDGVQAAGRIPVNLHELGVDLYSVSAHKMYAPKGAGALFIRKGVAVRPFLFGGSHERKRRAGTENVAGAVAFGAACERSQKRIGDEARRLASLRNRLQRNILARVPDAAINGDEQARVPNTLNICFDGVEGEAVVIALDLKGFSVSSGSACSSGAVEPSHVLTAMGLKDERARSSVRFSLGESNTEEQTDRLADAVQQSVSRLRSLSPRYEVHA